MAGSASNIARLEQARTAAPSSEPVERSLGIAYFKATRYADARSTLQRASAENPRDGVAALYLGLTAEAQHDLPAARSAYEAYLKVGRTDRVKRQISDRLAVLSLAESEQAAKAAVAEEQQLSSTPGTPRTVAVLPFTFTGADTSLRPLERGFAELVSTDLSQSSQLVVVERTRLQSVLNEIDLQHKAGVEAGTGVRAGKILQAGRLVSGTISELGSDQLRADAFVTNVQTTQVVGTASSAPEAINQLFNVEKSVVFGLFTELGVTITTAERNAIEQRPTQSLAAFLAYSRGLELEDQGRFDDAARFFDNAVRLDPNFGAARQKSVQSKSLVAGARVTANTVESSLRGTTEGAAVSASNQGVATISTFNTALAAADGLNPSPAAGATSGTNTASTQPVRDAAAGTGADNPTSRDGRVTIVIHQPGTP